MTFNYSILSQYNFTQYNIFNTFQRHNFLNMVGYVCPTECSRITRPRLRCSLYVSGIIQDLKREISGHGTIDVLTKEIERITSQEEQEHLVIEENERMQTIVAELRRAIADKKTANEKEEERLTKKLTLTRVNVSQVAEDLQIVILMEK